MQGAIPKQESRIPYVTYDVDNLNDREVEENIFDDETVWLDADDLSPPFHYSSDMEQEDSVKPPYR
ncbi:Uncharacterised protein [Bordetella trematum]|nr:Uncharacterised protein [Bordetella trematum]VDH08814.1 Uncharacterised protein [Bordetella trematum]